MSIYEEKGFHKHIPDDPTMAILIVLCAIADEIRGLREETKLQPNYPNPFCECIHTKSLHDPDGGRCHIKACSCEHFHEMEGLKAI